MAAWRAHELGADVTVFEKTNRIGTKILISGGGKCNITHDGPLEDVLKAFRPNEARFIRPACYRFPPPRIVEMLTSRGLRVYTREDGRIFPIDQTAKDVVAILQGYLEGVRIRFNTPVARILRDEDGLTAIELKDGTRETFDAVILTVGGASYPNSGTTGDGWPWAAELGHTIVPLKAALAPILTDPEPQEGWPGVALRNVFLKGRNQGKEVVRWRGDLLFTHHGISGPATLGISRVIAEHGTDCTLDIDLMPDHTFEQMAELFQRWQQENPKREIKTWLAELVPAKLVSEVLQRAEATPEHPLPQLAKKTRNRLTEVLKRFEIGRAKEVVYLKGEVVAGGVALNEVDPHTMASLVCPRLYLAGEVLDVAGPVGGYNLQAAWATGFVAGESATNALLGTS